MNHFKDIFTQYCRSYAHYCRQAVLCFLLVAQFAGGTAFPVQDAAGQNSLVVAGSSSSQRPLAVELPEPLPEFDPDNPQAIGVILAFHRWPDEDERRIILEKTTEAGLMKTKEFPRFKIWIFAWDDWKQATTAEKVCSSLPTLSSLKYCEPDYLLGPDTSALQ